MKTPTPKLSPTTLYHGDNGRIFCGALRCAGVSSHYTGRDISGQRVEPVGPEAAAEFASYGLTLKCEGCGAVAS